MMSMNHSDIAILNIKGTDYCSKNDAIKCLSEQKKRNIIKYKKSISIYKNG